MLMKNQIKYLILLLPFLDLITALLTRNYNLIITPGLIIKGFFMLGAVYYILITKSKYKKISLGLIVVFLLYMLFYFIFKIELINRTFIFNEVSYLFKLFFFPIIFLGLICFFDEDKLNKNEIIKLMKINLISMTLLLLIPLLLKTAHRTYPTALFGYIGWFYAGNEIANIMIILYPFLYYFIDEKKKYQFLIFLPIIYSILKIGTKVSLLGLIIVGTINLIYSLLKREKGKSFLYSISINLIILLTILGFSYKSYAIYNFKYMTNYYNEKGLIIDESDKEAIEDLMEDINFLYNDNYFGKLIKPLLSNRNLFLANTLNIYGQNENNHKVWFGIGFSNTHKINDKNIAKLIEIDVLDIYFHYGICGLLIMLSPFLAILYLIIKKRSEITLTSLYYLTILFLIFGISSFSGHVFMAPAVSIYLIFYLILLANEFKLFKPKEIVLNKISILTLHMGYGGIERSIVNQANMLSEKYNVEIVSLYKLNKTIPYRLNDKVKLIYLSNLKPNKEEFLYYFKKRNIFKILQEGIKSTYILYQKEQLVKKHIINSNSKIIISTRIEFTKLLSRYGNKSTIKIAEEHSHHDNNLSYIKKLERALRNVDYLIPPSKYLDNDYKEYFKNLKIKYIPQTIDHLAKKLNKLDGKNVLFVGRLEAEKGVPDLIETFRIVNNKNKAIKLIIAGDGSQKKDLINLVNKYNLQDNVIFKGYLNSQDLDKVYQKTSLFVTTSFKESFGLVLIEAMSYGIPCFAFSSALGAKEIIDNKNGKLVADRNREKLANEILKYFNNPNKEAFSSNAYQTASKYSTENVKLLWFKFIDRILEEE